MVIPAPLRPNIARWSTALAAAVLLACSLPASAGNFVDREYDQAVRAFRAGRLSEAFGRFVDLANRGDVDSARVALFMQTYGPALYGKQWDAGPQDAAYWTMLIRNSGTSARPLPAIEQTVLTPGGKGKAHRMPVRARPSPELAVVAD